MEQQLSPKRLKQLSLPKIAEEVEVIKLMTQIYCKGKHTDREKNDELCQECQDFVNYAIKRLSCCPFGEEKPVCKKCKIHCFQKDWKAKAKEVMAYSGPRLIFKRPGLIFSHLLMSLKKAPDKPRAVRISVVKDKKEI